MGFKLPLCFYLFFVLFEFFFYWNWSILFSFSFLKFEINLNTYIYPSLNLSLPQFFPSLSIVQLEKICRQNVIVKMTSKWSLDHAIRLLVLFGWVVISSIFKNVLRSGIRPQTFWVSKWFPQKFIGLTIFYVASSIHSQNSLSHAFYTSILAKRSSISSHVN